MLIKNIIQKLILLFPLLKKELIIINCFNEEQLQNEPSPIDVTDDGIINSSKEEQLLNE